jgi:hypothetical protein
MLLSNVKAIDILTQVFKEGLEQFKNVKFRSSPFY